MKGTSGDGAGTLASRLRGLAPFVLGLLAAVGLVVAGFQVSDTDLNLGPELMKAGVQVGAVTLIAAGIAEALRRGEERRSADRSKAEFRSRLFRDVVSAYNGVKLERRTMRAHGYSREAPDRELTEEDAAFFNARMRSLATCQLAVEQVAREVSAKPEWFSQRDELEGCLNKVECYVNQIVDAWEGTHGEVMKGAATARIHSLDLLQQFLDDDEVSFRPNAADPMRRIERLLHEDLYGTARTS